MNVGDKVRILPPFDVHYPKEYKIVDLTETAFTVDLDGTVSDFDAQYIEVVATDKEVQAQHKLDAAAKADLMIARWTDAKAAISAEIATLEAEAAVGDIKR